MSITIILNKFGIFHNYLLHFLRINTYLLRRMDRFFGQKKLTFLFLTLSGLKLFRNHLHIILKNQFFLFGPSTLGIFIDSLKMFASFHISLISNGK
jgi:hypothetical protein